MNEDAQTAIIETLLKIQAEFTSFMQSVENRFDRLEGIIRKQRRETAGLLVMARALTPDFDARVSEIEERVTTLEGERRI